MPNFYIFDVSISIEKIKKLKKDNHDPDALKKTTHNQWTSKEILNFFNKNNILTESAYARWRKENHPEKNSIPSMMTLKKIKDWPGFPKSGKQYDWYPMNKIIQHLKTFKISSQKEYLQWRKTIPDGKKLYPANLYGREGFPGWDYFKQQKGDS